jgi:transcription factor WhiB
VNDVVLFPSLPSSPLGQWVLNSACAGQSDLFYDNNWPGLAKSLCVVCPVTEECRDYIDALEVQLPVGHWFGIWAGETPTERAVRRGKR